MSLGHMHSVLKFLFILKKQIMIILCVQNMNSIIVAYSKEI